MQKARNRQVFAFGRSAKRRFADIKSRGTTVVARAVGLVVLGTACLLSTDLHAGQDSPSSRDRFAAVPAQERVPVVQTSNEVLTRAAAVSDSGQANNNDGNSSLSSDSKPSGTLQEIVVTAERRSESVMNVPMSITAMSQQALEQRGVRDVDDVSRTIPGLSFTNNGQTSSIAVRGITSQGVGSATTGIYIDDTPIQVRSIGSAEASTNSYPQIFDLDRIEVLRGPQGTLFGAGSEGGTVRFITPVPNLQRYDMHARGEVGFTERGAPTYEGGLAVGGPIMQDSLGFRLSGLYRNEGGWIDRANPVTGGILNRDINSKDVTALRAGLRLVSGNFELLPSIFYQRVRWDGLGQYWRSLEEPGAGQFVSGNFVMEPGSDKFTLYSLNGKYQMSLATLNIDTSYFDRKNPSTADYSDLIPELLGLDPLAGRKYNSPSYSITNVTQGVFTAEARLTSSLSGPFRWIVGMFYQDARQTSTQDLPTPNFGAVTLGELGGTVQDIFGVPLLEPGDSVFLGHDRARDKQMAAYGQLDYAVMKSLTLTVGARLAYVRNNTGNDQSGPYNGGESSFETSRAERAVTPKYGIQYKPTEDFLLYATAAKGFRMGGGNPPVPITQCGAELAPLGYSKPPATFESDHLWSYEIGSKGSVNRIFRFETSAFYINWSAIQSNVYLAGCGFGFIGNLGSATSKGGDLQLTLRPATGLMLAGSISYTDATYDKTVFGGGLPSGSQGQLINSGDPLLVSPWTGNVNVDYELPITIGTDSTAYVHGDYSFASGYGFGRVGTPTFDPLVTRQDASSIGNFRVGIRKSHYDVSLFVNNVSNSRDVLSVWHGVPTTWIFRDFSFRPRTIGLTATYQP